MRELWYRTLLAVALILCLGLVVSPSWAQEGGRQQGGTGNNGGRPQREGGEASREDRQAQQQQLREAAAQERAGRAERGEGNARSREPRAAREASQTRQAPSSPALGEFTVSINTSARMLRLHPEGKSDRQDLQVAIGQEFTTEVSFDNQDLVPFTEIRVLLSYDPECLEPVAINDARIASNLRAEPTAEVDPLYGVLMYEAQLGEPLILNNVPLLAVRWKAKKVTRETRIEFSSREDIYTVVVGDGRDLLGNPRQPGDGTLNMAVTILPEDPREAEAFMADPEIFQGTGEKVGGVRLFIKAPEEPLVVGQPVALDIIFDNRAFSTLDNLEMLLTYDPSVFEVIDTDQDNLVTIERNILDGPFRQEFPWNFHIDNVVYQHRGIISYRVGTDDPDSFRGKYGTVARIYMVPQKPTMGSAVTFRYSRKARISGTAVTFNGHDCLGDPDVFGDGARGVLLQVLPADAVDAALGNGTY